MISFINGTVAELEEDCVILECNGIGYQILVSETFLSQLRIGSYTKIYTYMHVREDAIGLFGFASRDELGMFKLLISVSGIGPKGALGVLSVLSPDDIRFAVLADDAKTITSAPGIGLKTAKKLILELKDKLKLEEAVELKRSHIAEKSAAALAPDARDEAVAALTALGYSGSEAMKAVRAVDNASEMTVEQLLKAALKNMALF